MPFDPDARLAEWRKSLLDISKRNRLIKFAAGRGGGAYLLRPSVGDLWGRLVCEGARLTFARKAEILGLPPEVVDADTLAADFDPQSGAAAGADVARELTEMCLRSPNLPSDHLLTEFTDRQLAARLTRLFRTAREGATDHLRPGEVVQVGSAADDLHWVANARADAPSISIHVYGGNIGAVERQTFDPATGAARRFVSGYSNTAVPNLWDRSQG